MRRASIVMAVLSFSSTALAGEGKVVIYFGQLLLAGFGLSAFMSFTGAALSILHRRVSWARLQVTLPLLWLGSLPVFRYVLLPEAVDDVWIKWWAIVVFAPSLVTALIVVAVVSPRKGASDREEEQPTRF